MSNFVCGGSILPEIKDSRESNTYNNTDVRKYIPFRAVNESVQHPTRIEERPNICIGALIATSDQILKLITLIFYQGQKQLWVECPKSPESGGFTHQD